MTQWNTWSPCDFYDFNTTLTRRERFKKESQGNKNKSQPLESDTVVIYGTNWAEDAPLANAVLSERLWHDWPPHLSSFNTIYHVRGLDLRHLLDDISTRSRWMALDLSFRILDGQRLRHETVLLDPLTDMINRAYLEIDADGAFPRLPDRDAIWKEFGHVGVCVIVQDRDRGDLPVAITGAKAWKPDVGVGQAATWREWEIGPVATRDEPSYRRRGLIDRCLALLYEALLGISSGTEIRVWMKVEEGVRVDYWRKKGFAQVGSRWLIPVGEWHAELGFAGIDMCKTISREL